MATADSNLPEATGKFERDLRELMTCFQEVLADLGHGDLAGLLPWVGASRGAESSEALCTEPGLQALSISFQLLNMVEENAGNQTRRQVERRHGMGEERGLWGHELRALIAEGFSPEDLAAALRQVWIEPVLTAHPTEAKRSSVLEQNRQLYLLLVKRENPMWTPAEQELTREQVKAALERIWRTGEIMQQKPDLATERRGVLYFLRDVFPEAVQRLDWHLRQSWKALGLDPRRLDGPGAMPRLTFGTWVGGDRDGHRLVTAAVTRETLHALREAAVSLHDRNLLGLAQRLSLSTMRQEAPPVLTTAIAETADKLGEIGRRAIQRNPDEPWRQYLNLLRARLPLREPCATVDVTYHYRRPAEFLADLRRLYESLIEVGSPRLAEHEVLPVLRTAEVFGFHLATLDIRQNSAFHDRAMAQLLTAAGLDDADYPAWPEAKRLELLTQELRSPRPLAHGLAQLGAEAQDVLDGYRTLASHGEEFGYDGLGSLIVSMTRSVSDLLAVYVLAREAGLVRPTADGLVCRLPVMPLFETVEDLAAAPDILHRFLQHPITERSLPRHHDRPVQQVMLGYSDSAKAAGIFAGQWALYQAQKQLTAVARLFGVTVRFFHGRGGTVSRGAGPTHRFLEALPHGSLAGLFRATEQGETISQKYANLLTAAYNLELLLAGVTATTLRHQRAAPDVDDLDAVMQHLAAHSQQAYQDLLAEPGFLTYFAQATPIDAIEESRIGSRPTRRTGERTLEDLRAIPWVFSWTQSRHYLPGWYGLGYALQQLAREQPAVFERLEQAIPRWPYLRYVLGSIETNLVSADLDIMRQYAGLVGDADVRHRVFHLITHEYLRTRRFLERVLGGNVQTRRPRLWSTVQWRAAGLRALHEMQIRLLSQWRDCLAAADAAGAAALLPRVLLSVNALASGLRTTG